MKIHKCKLFWFSSVVTLALILSACGASSKEPTPTPVDVNAVAATAIANFAKGLTQTAFAQPTSTFTPQPSATNTLAPVTFSPFGTGTPGVQPTSSCDVLIFVDDLTVKDGTLMAPGQVFPKTWRIKNGGTCTWTPTYKVVFTGSGIGPMGGVTTPIGKIVKPGESVDITVTFTAPATAGDYTSWWKIQNDSGVWLAGTIFSVAIKVVGAPAPTGTPTETPIPTP
jgi:hypothetical protein